MDGFVDDKLRLIDVGESNLDYSGQYHGLADTARGLDRY